MPAIEIVHQDGTKEIIPDGRPLEVQKDDVLNTIANHRWYASEYFVFEGEKTRADVTAITSAVMARQLAGVELPPIMWKLNASAFRSFDTEGLTNFCMAAQKHVSACFAVEAEKVALVLAAETGEELDLIDPYSGWPEGGL